MSASFRPETTPSDIPPQVTEAAAKRLEAPATKRQKLDTARGARIVEARSGKRWTRRQLANQCDGLRVGLVEDLERGCNAAPEVFRDVAAALGVDLLWLLNGKAALATAAKPVLLETPLAAIARRHDKADQDGVRYDIGGDLRASLNEQAANEGLNRANADELGCLEQACDHPATTLADAAFQLYATSAVADGLTGAFNGDPAGTAGIDRVLRGTTSALRVVAAYLAGSGAPGLQHVAQNVRASWEGVLPPVTLATMPLQSAEDAETGRLVDEALALVAGSDRPGVGDDELDRAIATFDMTARAVLARRSHAAGMRHKLRLLNGYSGAGDEIGAELHASIAADLDALLASGPSQHPDAELLALCQEYGRIGRERQGFLDIIDAAETDEAIDAAEKQAKPLEDTLDAMKPRLCEVPATTAEGIVARFHALRFGQKWWTDQLASEDKIMAAIVQDLDALPSPAALHPDATLIAACREYEALDRRWCAIIAAGGHSPAEEAAAEAKGESLARERDALLIRLRELRAVTPDGLTERARLLSYVNGNWASSWERDEGSPGTMLEALLRDAAALTGTAPAAETLRRAA